MTDAFSRFPSGPAMVIDVAPFTLSAQVAMRPPRQLPRRLSTIEPEALLTSSGTMASAAVRATAGTLAMLPVPRSGCRWSG